MNEMQEPRLGQFVKVLRGRDAGTYAVITGIEESRYVKIADGDKRKFDQPKRKNLLHLELQTAMSHEVVQSLNESGRVTNSKLRYVISKFAEEQAAQHAEQRGE
ncbi:KOW domain-containing RNA-binding protein [Paenibacillus apiarius]|uniref:KOW domain-containing RNA-binding protein n=1 Tax=Paenibacillus apiarius TaxID=46240 RepID=A0ABT4DTS5_9BACL|nr:KOW domain-containing RNA-binding protein [Paenibacillus apiarius]MBN3523724.1 KOW domain-containing RNA-binding protein [Paenibacillus apiarius]MCY9516292.1 KOW domain-containing RNA-binding protein [Paenibacillus apiarius]MCY9520655.1 KOW domain-containing RNA-binding protein [Paenibacillus apiarius]MCY9552510.1 KOW domain-containing RNA-binding protein [Paenibacillus apiarius]MCY9561016.1 KOW domain-containing RNA-binding protein [Paenibacillus apiarius]